MLGESRAKFSKIVIEMKKFSISYSEKNKTFYKGIILDAKSLADLERKFKKMFPNCEIEGLKVCE